MGKANSGDCMEVRLETQSRPQCTRTYRFNPSTLVHKWSVPELFIHGSKDYRLPETESIAPFHALQELVVDT